MANPYDFTSGYFQSRNLAEQRQQAEDMKEYRTEAIKLQRDEFEAKKPYFGALTGQAEASADASRAAADKSRFDIRKTKARYKFGGIPLGDEDEDFSYVTSGTTAGFSQKGFDLSDKESLYGAEKKPQEYFGLKVPRFKDGTLGGLQTQPAETITLDQSATDESASAPEQNDPVKFVSKAAPKVAKKIVNDVFNATPTQTNEMLRKFAMVDWADEKITSAGLQNQLTQMKQLQAEGFAQAAELALMGKKDLALKAFSQVGTDMGDNIADVAPIDIKNPVAGAAKKTNDTYKGLKIIYKDGSEMQWDPKRFLVFTANLEKQRELISKDEEYIRKNDATIFGIDSQNARTALDRQLRTDQLSRDEEIKRDKGLLNEFSLHVKGRQQAFTRDNPGNTIDPELKQQKLDEIEQMGMVGYNVAKANLRMGNKNVTAGSVVPYLPYMGDITNQVADKAKIDFWKNPNNFARGEDGKPLGMEFENRKYLKARDGTLLPMPFVDIPAEPSAGTSAKTGSAKTGSAQQAIPQEDRQRYIRSVSPRGGFVYTPSGRGLTKREYQELDAREGN